jgi:hypothetical protein
MDYRFIGEAVDRLVTVPMSNWTILKGLPLTKTYEAARAKGGGEPLTLKAARLLNERVKKDDTVLLLSGFVILNWNRPETDGPIGVAALARSLDLALGAVPVILTEDILVNNLAKTTEAAGMIVCDNEEELRRGGRGRKALVMGFPIDHEEAKIQAIEILDRLNPKAVIAVERPGWNEKQVHHSGMGYNISDVTAKLDYLFLEAQKRGILTIGVGDLGNEMGMGYVEEEVKTGIPNGATCLCGCGGGIACHVSADVGLICNISNWGAYGICACLAALAGEEEVLHDGKLEKRMISACVDAGALDPVSGMLIPRVDGEPDTINAYIVEMLNGIVRHVTRGSIFTRSYQATGKKKIENI